MRFLKDKFSFSKKKLIPYLLLLILILFILIMRFWPQSHEFGKRADRDYIARLRALQTMLDKSQEGSKKSTASRDKEKDLEKLAEYESFYQSGTELYKKAKLIEAANSFERALKAKDTKEVRTTISQIYNLLAMREIENKNYDGAIKYFEKSFEISRNDQSLLGIANVYILKEDLNSALSTLEKSLDIYSKNPKIYHHLGQIYYQKGDIEKAINYWKKTLELDPSDIQTEMILNKAKMNLGIDDSLLKIGAKNFQIDFQGKQNEIAQEIVLTLFQRASEKVGKDLNIYPSSKLKILLDFNTMLNIENQNPNKNLTIDIERIKVPLSGFKKATEVMERAITYSYTKFTILDYMNRRCPAWFSEGLSLYEANEINIKQIELIKDMIKSGSFIKLEDLNPSFQSPEKKDLSLAYAVSFAAVDYLINKYGLTSIRELIAKVRAGESFEEGIKSVLNLSPADLQRNWESYLKEQYKI